MSSYAYSGLLNNDIHIGFATSIRPEGFALGQCQRRKCRKASAHKFTLRISPTNPFGWSWVYAKAPDYQFLEVSVCKDCFRKITDEDEDEEDLNLIFDHPVSGMPHVTHVPVRCTEEGTWKVGGF